MRIFELVEVDVGRRGFLRGIAGAAALGAAGSSLAKNTTDDPLGQFIQTHDIGSTGSSADQFAAAMADDDIGRIATGRLDPRQLPHTASPAKAPNTKTAQVSQTRPAALKTKPPVITQPPGSVPWQDIAEYCHSRWKMTREQIAGMLANIRVESQFFANDLHMDSNGLPAGGLFSHNGPRLEQMVQKLGRNWRSNWRGQIDFALSEPDGARYKSRNYASPDAASRAWTLGFERPARAQQQADRRAPAARQFASNI